MKFRSPLLVVVCFLVALTIQAQVPRSSHVMVITLENHSYEQVIGNVNTPYFNQLVSQYSLADDYFATQHNSLAALMWLTTGSQVTTNNSTLEIFIVDHIAARVWQSGQTWKAYLESLPSIGFTGYAASGPYLKRHNPYAYFSDVVNSNQRFNLLPLSPNFAQDIANRILPNFSYVVPDAGDDAHDGTLAQADQWLQANVPQLLANPDFQKDGLLFIVWDEGNLSPLDARWTGGRVATLVIGPRVKTGYHSTTFYTHQDLLRTLCDALALGGCPGNGATGVPMADFFPPASTSPHIQLLAPTANLNAAKNPLRFVANIISDKPASTMIVYADNREIFRTQGGHTDFKMDLSTGPHLLVVNGWDSLGRLMQASV
ncbi:MAG TPA: alkaline phosphatase family protein, partial [Candidatus Angelobacter sp.]|nr:alkaline phosphatase family protein [Candidatus Angelobacter sp.]